MATMVSKGILYVMIYEGMVTDLSELHDGVHESLGSSLSSLALLGAVGQHHTPVLHVSVYNALESRHLTFDHILHLIWQLRLHLLLQTTQ